VPAGGRPCRLSFFIVTDVLRRILFGTFDSNITAAKTAPQTSRHAKRRTLECQVCVLAVLVHFEQAWKVVDLPLILTAALARCYGGAKEWERFQPFTSGATR